MDAREIYADIVAVATDTNTCPHGVLPHVANVQGFHELTEDMLQVTSDALDLYLSGHDDGTNLGNMLAHIFVVFAGIGYAVGSEHAFDIVLEADVSIPDTLAALDFLEPMDRDGRGQE